MRPQPTILFIGESPSPDMAPGAPAFSCRSGTRLARALGLRSRADLADGVRPVNLFDAPRGIKGAPDWDDAAARHAAAVLTSRLVPGSVVVALGQRVRVALTAAPRWPRVLVVPHPSGASTALNTERGRRELRRVVLPALAALGSLELAAFDLDDPTVLLDLAPALHPEGPATALAALLDPAQARKVPLARLADGLQRNTRRLRAAGPDQVYLHWCASEWERCDRAVREASRVTAEDVLRADSVAQGFVEERERLRGHG